MKRIILLVVGALVVFFALFAFRQCGGGGATEYQTTTITHGAITQAGLCVISPGGHARGKARARLCASQG